MYSPALRSRAGEHSASRCSDNVGAARSARAGRELPPARSIRLIGIAPNYDELVDSPVEVGTFQQSSFQQDGATYHVVVHGNPADYDMAKLDGVLKQITHAEVDWMQDRPYDEYTFLYHFPHGPGGRRHGARLRHRDRRQRRRGCAPTCCPWPSVTAHEFFHLWNVKRIRPQSLEPIDYQARDGHARTVVQRRRDQHGG